MQQKSEYLFLCRMRRNLSYRVNFGFDNFQNETSAANVGIW